MSGQASANEARDELARLRPDVMRVAAGLAANPWFMEWVAPAKDGGGLELHAFALAQTALGIVRAVDKECGAEP